MSGCRRPPLIALVIALATGLAACEDAHAPTELAAEAIVAPALARGGNGALTQRTTMIVPAPNAVINAPCLDLGEDLRLGGTWTIRIHRVETPSGKLNVKRRIDYSDTFITAGTLTWLASPGASENIIANGPLTGGGSAFVLRHEFRARYFTQDGLPDLLVSHRIKVLVGPDGQLRKLEGFPPSFAAKCIGGGT